MRGRWAPPSMEGKGPREGQRMAIGQQAPPAADENTLRRHGKPPPATLQYARNLELGPQLGVLSDADPWWIAERRESFAQKIQRINLLFASLFDQVDVPIVSITSHAGFIREATTALGLKPYFAKNCELVPVVVEDRRDRR